jgi:RimJ/RimL family protein N-acetyltransferase
VSDVVLREIEDADLDALFAFESDPGAAAMAAFPSRDRERFDAHWARVRADPTTVTRAVVVDGQVAGNIGCWADDDQYFVGYWIGRPYWGRGVATRALGLMLAEVSARPLHAHVAAHNAGSVRVLEKCGFRRDPAHETHDPDDGVEEHLYVVD